jgi:hypothetical protein
MATDSSRTSSTAACRAAIGREQSGSGALSHCEGMATFIVPAGAGEASAIDAARLPLAAAAYLARFKGLSREHTDSDLRVFLAWCAERRIEPLAARRRELELYVRWMQETRRYKPSTVSRRTSVVTGFYRTCVIDGLLDHSPAEYARRPTVPAESPTLGLTHLQFEAMITAARTSANINDFSLVAMLDLLGLRIFKATGADIADLGEEHGHRVLRVVARAPASSSSRSHLPWGARSTERSATAHPGRSCSTPAEGGWIGTPPPAGCATSPPTPASGCRECIPTCSGTPT